MDACCEICGLIAFVDDGELQEKVVELVCIRCNTLHYVTPGSCYAAPVARRSSPPRRPSSPPPLRRKDTLKRVAPKRDEGDRAAGHCDRLDDLRALAKQSDAARDSVSPNDDSLIDAPPSVRELIRTASFARVDTPTRPRPRRWRNAGIVAVGMTVAVAAFFTARRFEQGGWRIHPPAALSVQAHDNASETAANGAQHDTTVPVAPPARLDAIVIHGDPSPSRLSGRFDPRRVTGRAPIPTPSSPEPASGEPPAPPATSPSALAEAMAAVVAEKPGPAGFDHEVARAALLRAAVAVQGCKQSDADAGQGAVTVTFAPSGAIVTISLSGTPFAGTQTGACIASLFKAVHLSAFSGPSVTVHRDFIIR